MRDDWRTAVIEGDCRAIEGLLEDTDIDCRDHYRQTALILAVLHGREEVVNLLLEKGADLNVTAKYRLSALMLAVIRGHEAIARQLVDAGANLETAWHRCTWLRGKDSSRPGDGSRAS